MAIRTSNVEAMNRMLDRGQMGSELHAMIKARQWSGAASLINGEPRMAMVNAEAHHLPPTHALIWTDRPQ